MHIHPYLTFKNAKEAMDYYCDVFGAKINYRQPLSADSAENLGLSTDNLDDTTLYGEITIDGHIIACADAVLGASSPSSMVSIMLDFADDVSAAKEMFQKVTATDEQKVTVPFAAHETGGMYGRVVDKYGINWVITSNVASSSQEAEEK